MPATTIGSGGGKVASFAKTAAVLATNVSSDCEYWKTVCESVAANDRLIIWEMRETGKEFVWTNRGDTVGHIHVNDPPV